MKIVYALMTQDRLGAARSQVERMLPAVDDVVVVDNGSTDGTRKWLEAAARETGRVHPVLRQWNDNFVEARNAYVSKAAEIAEDPMTLVVSDDDEVFSDGVVEDLRDLCDEMYYDDLNILRVRSRSVETDWKGDEHWSKLDDWHKPLIFLWEPGFGYHASGAARGQVHEDIHIPSGYRQRFVDDQDGRRVYSHIKRHGEIWPRAIRNAYAGGGGMNLGDLVPWWRDFRDLVRRETGAETSDAFVRFLRDALNLPPGLKDFFVQQRLVGTQWDSRTDLWPGWPDGTSEWREGFLAYYVYFHPEQMPPSLAVFDKAAGYMDYAASVRIIHPPEKVPEWARE